MPRTPFGGDRAAVFHPTAHKHGGWCRAHVVPGLPERAYGDRRSFAAKFNERPGGLFVMAFAGGIPNPKRSLRDCTSLDAESVFAEPKTQSARHAVEGSVHLGSPWAPPYGHRQCPRRSTCSPEIAAEKPLQIKPCGLWEAPEVVPATKGLGTQACYPGARTHSGATVVTKTSRVSRIPFVLLFILAYALAVSGVARAQTFSVLHTFQYFPHGASPYAPLYRDASGNLYGTTNGGGQYNAGVVFKIDTTGHETVLHTFTGGIDGGNPTAGVVIDSVGNLYGTAYQGGIAGAGVNHRGAGVVFEINTSGKYTVLYSFTGGADGSGPFAGVILDSAGNLYGTTYNGGLSGNGVVFKVGPSVQETVLYSFTGSTDGANPYAGVTMDAVGNLYGTTYNGGYHGFGVVFKLSASGQQTVVYSFGGAIQGAIPYAGVVLDSAGNIYGAAGSVAYKLTPAGSFTELAYFGANTRLSGIARDGAGNLYITVNAGGGSPWPNGAVFKFDTAGRFSSLYQFKGDQLVSGISLPGSLGLNANVVLDSAGNLYGTTPFDGTAGIVYEIEASGTVKTLYNFQPARGGMWPRSGLTLDRKGNLYGTASWGGGPADAGVVFKLSPSGKETVLYTFKGGSTDGFAPQTNVVLDQAGNIYGGTAIGGKDNQGVIYKLTPSGQETILHSFTGRADGSFPTGVAIDSSGNLYGTAALGGAGSQTGIQEGVVFKIDTAGNFSVLHSFTGLTDGGVPDGGVAIDSAGNLYGTTNSGGLGYPGAGVVFKIDTTGAYSVLHGFLASTDGGYPQAGVTLDPAGNIYGTCSGYGPQGGGTVFKLDSAGSFSVVYAFKLGGWVTSMAGVALDAAGNIYGTLPSTTPSYGGSPGSYGIVYKIDKSGTETVLYTFNGGTDGADPEAVTLDRAGHLYGVTGGLFFTPVGGGTAFKITLP